MALCGATSLAPSIDSFHQDCVVDKLAMVVFAWHALHADGPGTEAIGAQTPLHESVLLGSRVSVRQACRTVSHWNAIVIARRQDGNWRRTRSNRRNVGRLFDDCLPIRTGPFRRSVHCPSNGGQGKCKNLHLVQEKETNVFRDIGESRMGHVGVSRLARAQRLTGRFGRKTVWDGVPRLSCYFFRTPPDPQ